MKKIILIILVLLTFGVCTAQNVTNCAFRQVNKKVEVTYNLDKTANISLLVSTDGGKTFSTPLKHVTGDVGNNVTAGNKTIIWDALAEVDKIVGSQIVFKVTAEPKIGKQTFRVNGVSFTMVYVQGGTFTMGAHDNQLTNVSESEKPAHSVTLSSFAIGETEVTQALWVAVMGNNPSEYEGNILRPVEYISWNDCQEFIRKLNSLTGKNFRMPTEAEWEFAARGGNNSHGYKYSGSNNIDDVAWYDSNSEGQTHPVKQKQPNELGLYDMTGNVLEWCSDWYGSYSSSYQTNPKGPSTGYYRLCRGSSWRGDSWTCRSSYRYGNYPDNRGKSSQRGLRLALSE